MYCIISYNSEPHHQHQNSSECCIGHIKDIRNHVLTFTHAPNNLWLLCLMYVVYILNITANSCIGNISPHQHLYSQTPLISPTLCFQFYEPVYYSDTNSFPAPIEKRGDGLVSPPTPVISSPSASLQMIPIRLSITQLSVPLSLRMERIFILNSPKWRMTPHKQ